MTANATSIIIVHYDIITVFAVFRCPTIKIKQEAAEINKSHALYFTVIYFRLTINIIYYKKQ